VRVASSESGGSIAQVAFANPDGRLVVVAHNTGGATAKLRVGTGASAMNVDVPANGGVTLAWTPPP
jgi:O-glycosyl hydrolase